MSVFGIPSGMGGFGTMGMGMTNPQQTTLPYEYQLAEAYSVANFNQQYRNGLMAAFGGAPEGPIRNVVNMIASQLTGSGRLDLAQLFPATDMFQSQYFGAPNISPGFQQWGLSNPNPLAAMATSFPFQPGLAITNLGGASPEYLQQSLGTLSSSVLPAVWQSGFPSLNALG